MTLDKCINRGLISGEKAGGICGRYVSLYGSVVNITDCYNTGVVQGANAGGICGTAAGQMGNLTLNDCRNEGEISGTAAGGICGANVGYYDTTSSNYTGVSKVIIEYCWNTGAISGERSGGICGRYTRSAIIKYCYNTGNLSNNNCCGICGPGGGNAAGPIIIFNCFNTGSGDTTYSNQCSISRAMGDSTGAYPILIYNCWSDGTDIDFVSTASTLTAQVNIVHCYGINLKSEMSDTTDTNLLIKDCNLSTGSSWSDSAAGVLNGVNYTDGSGNISELYYDYIDIKAQGSGNINFDLYPDTMTFDLRWYTSSNDEPWLIDDASNTWDDSSFERAQPE
jgi:hypothetical protein